MKNIKLFITAGLVLTSLVGLVFLLDKPQSVTEIKEAKAEQACPASFANVYIEIRQNSSSGPILGSFGTGPSFGGPEPGSPIEGYVDSASLSVPSGTVIYINAYSQGVDPTTRSLGTVQSSNLPVTVLNNPVTGDGGGYKPSGYYYTYTRQQYVLAASDPLTNSGNIRIEGSNSCNAQPGQTGDELEDAFTMFSLSINVAPAYSFTCGVDQYLTAGETAQYVVSAFPDSGFNSSIAVTMGSNPSGPAMSPDPISLSSSNGYTAMASIDTTSLQPNQYNLTFTATGGGVTRTCTALLDLQPPQPSVTLYWGSTSNPGPGPYQPTPTNGSSGTLLWETENVSTCIGSMLEGDDTTPGWIGSKSPEGGSFQVQNMATSNNYWFRIICDDNYAETDPVESNLQVNVGPPNPPTADLKCLSEGDLLPTDGPCNVSWESATELSWVSSNATNCEITSDVNSSFSLTGTSGSGSSGNLNATNVFTLTCRGYAGATPNVVTDSLAVNVSPSPDFSLSCSVVAPRIRQSQAADLFIEVNAKQGFSSPVTITHSISPSSNAPEIGYDASNPANSPYDQDVKATVRTTGSTDIGNYTITFRGNGINPIDCDVFVEEAPTPVSPIAVTVDNLGVCDAVNVSWRPGSGSPQPSSYKVWRKVDSGDWQDTGITKSADKREPDGSYLVNIPGDIGTPYLYGVTSVLGGSESSPPAPSAYPVAAQPCGASLDGSDKDMVQVENNATGNRAVACNGRSDVFAPQSQEVFRAGDDVTFRVNICNSGKIPLTNIKLIDSELTYLENLSWDKGRSDDCVQDFRNGNTFIISDLEAGKSCAVYMTATIGSPNGPAGDLYRFQNRGYIDTDELADYPVSTVPYLFSISGSAPDRTETPPIN